MAHEQQLKFLEILSNELSFNESNKNLKVIESSLSKASDKSSLENLRNQIVALA